VIIYKRILKHPLRAFQVHLCWKLEGPTTNRSNKQDLIWEWWKKGHLESIVILFHPLCTKSKNQIWKNRFWFGTALSWNLQEFWTLPVFKTRVIVLVLLIVQMVLCIALCVCRCAQKNIIMTNEIAGIWCSEFFFLLILSELTV
jgi:hypothetical protein